MIFKDGLEKFIKENPERTGGYEVAPELTSLRGDVGFIKILSDTIKGKDIKSCEDFLAEVKKAYERLTGKPFTLDEKDEEGAPVTMGFSQEIYDSDPTEEGWGWGWIDLTNWLGDEPKALDYIAAKYHLE